MAHLTHLFALTAVLGLAGSAVAQTDEAGGSEGPAESPLAQPEAPSPAAVEFAPIQAHFARVYESLMNKSGVTPDDFPVLRALHQRVLAFREKWPDDLRGLAADCQLSQWLGEDERAEDLRAQLVELMPENEQLRLNWAEKLRRENRYEDAAALIEEAGYDLTQSPQSALLLARCRFADEHFQEALDLLNAVSAEALEENRMAKGQIESLQKASEDYIGFWAREQEIRAAEAEADDLPRIELITDRGRILLELFENEAPNTVASFVSLVEKGFYDQTKFHRVIPNFMAQGGDPNTKPGATASPGAGGPGYFIPDELNPETARKHFTGSLSMANSGAPNSAGSQFFITHEPAYGHNGSYTVFGRVLEGVEIVRRIEKDDVLQSAKVLRKRDHVYAPSTLPDPTSPILIPSRPAESPPPESVREDE